MLGATAWLPPNDHPLLPTPSCKASNRILTNKLTARSSLAINYSTHDILYALLLLIRNPHFSDSDFNDEDSNFKSSARFCIYYNPVHMKYASFPT